MTIIVFLISFGVYLTTLCPTIFTGDSSELVTSAATLGIPHAPGYPLFTLLGKLFSLLIPFGNIAYRINLMNAVFAAGTVAMVYWLVKRLINEIATPSPEFSLAMTQRRIIAALSALILAVSKTFWTQAMVTEVFILNAFFAVSLLTLLVTDGTTVPPNIQSPNLKSQNKKFYLFFLLLGLATGNQHTMVLFVPGFMVLLVWKFYHNRRLLTIKNVVFAGLFTVLGASINLYLLYRAKQHPLINFGNPETVQRLIAVLTRREFGSFQLHPTALPFFSQEVIIQQIKEYGKLFYENFGLWEVIGLIGIWQMRKNKILLTGLTILFLVSGIIFILYSNLMPSALSFWRLQRFHILPNLIFVLFVGYGIQWIILKIPKLKYFVVGLLFLGLTISFFPNYLNCSLRYNYTVHDLGRNILAAIKPQSTLFIDAKTFDEPGSSIHYLRVVEKMRPDIKFYYRSGTMMSNSQDANHKNETESQIVAAAQGYPVRVAGATHGVYYLAINRDVLPQKYNFNIKGLVYELNMFSPHLNPLPQGARGMEEFYIFREQKNIAFIDEYSVRQILIHYPYFMGKKYFEQKDFVKSKHWFYLTTLMGYDMDWLHSNIGSLFSQAGDLQESEKYFLQAYKLNPYFPYTHFGLGFLYFQKKDYGRAITHFTQAIKIKTDYAEAYYNLGVAYIENKNYSEGAKALETYLSLVPESSNAVVIKDMIGQLRGR